MPVENTSYFPYFAFFGWFLGLLFLSFLNERIWSRIFPGLKYRFFVAPGVIVHELSHALACILLLAPIRRISFFSRAGGYVEHGRSRFGFLGQALIAMAPIFGITLFLWLLIYWFGFALEIKAVDFSSADPGATIAAFFRSAWDLAAANWSAWPFWIFIYLVISLVSALAPSKKDFQNAFAGLVFLFFLGLIIIYAGWGQHFLINLIGQYLGYIISLGLIWQAFSLIIGLPVYVVRKFFKTTRLQ